MVCMNSFLHGNSLACTLIINRPNKENPDNVKTLHSNHGNYTHYSNVVPLSRRKFRWVTWSSAQLWNSWAYKYGKRNAKRIVRWTRSNNLVLKSTEKRGESIDHVPLWGQKSNLSSVSDLICFDSAGEMSCVNYTSTRREK